MKSVGNQGVANSSNSKAHNPFETINDLRLAAEGRLLPSLSHPAVYRTWRREVRARYARVREVKFPKQLRMEKIRSLDHEDVA